jgi:molybdopterin synthase catalytic subunit
MKHISATEIDIAALLATAHHPKAGAVVLFSGETRINDKGKTVQYLEYEAQDALAEKMIAEIVEAAKQRWSLQIALAVHRTGSVAVSGCAVVVITASSHRSEAYAANRFIIDKIKHEVPIWKCEYFTDGCKQWGGNCNCQQITGDAHKHVYEFEDTPPVK